MVRPDETKWIERANKLLQSGTAATHELPPFTVSMLTAIYGANSAHVRAYSQRADQIAKDKSSGPAHQLFMYARGTVANTVHELEDGLVANLRMSIEGELLGDLVNLSKEALSRNGDETKNVAAVLAAASFEDCLRKLAAEKAGVTDRRKLEEIVGVLKDADVIKGGNVSLAMSMLKFRNDSMHADWQQVTRAQVESCLALTEGLLRDYFS